MIAPYTSAYYEENPYYIRYGNIYLYHGQEIYLYIMDYSVHGIEPYRYAISNFMRIYDYKKNEFVKISYNTTYPSVNLFDISKGKIITNSLHRVYMTVFCYFPGCESYDVNHIDGDKLNLHPRNLEWMTHKENMSHASKYIYPDRFKLTDQDIIEIIQMYNSHASIKDIADRFNISTGYVSDITTGIYIPRAEEIKKYFPVTRKKYDNRKLSEDDIKTIAIRYSNGEEYYELANEYEVDRSSLTKAIKRYAKNHPEIILRELKTFSKEMAEKACIFIENNKNLPVSELYSLCLEELCLESNSNNRKALSNLYNRNTYKDISSKYNW